MVTRFDWGPIGHRPYLQTFASVPEIEVPKSFTTKNNRIYSKKREKSLEDLKLHLWALDFLRHRFPQQNPIVDRKAETYV